MSPSRSSALQAARLALLAAALLSACSRRTFSTANGAGCQVTAQHGLLRLVAGDTVESVRAKCGHPCGAAFVVQGSCNRRPELAGTGSGVCQNSCDVYHDLAACYANGEVVAIHELPKDDVVGQPCWLR